MRKLFKFIRSLLKEIKSMLYDNDPVYNCDYYKNKGCSHVDGLVCNFPNCELNEFYKKIKNMRYERGNNIKG